MFFLPLALSFYLIDRTASGDTSMTAHLWPLSIPLFICYILTALCLFSFIFALVVWYGWSKDPLHDKNPEEHKTLESRMTELENSIAPIHNDLKEIKDDINSIRQGMNGRDNTIMEEERQRRLELLAAMEKRTGAITSALQ